MQKECFVIHVNAERSCFHQQDLMAVIGLITIQGSFLRGHLEDWLDSDIYID